MSTGTHCPSEHPLPALLAAHNASEWTGPTGNNTWLLRGRVPTLIDAGVGHPAHLEALARALDGASLAQVLVTHGHRDHASGAAAIAGRWPGVRVRRFGDPDGFADGEVLEAGDANVGVVHTPGHAPDQCCFELPAGAGVFCGDMARLGGTVVIPASKGGDLAHYLESLRQLQARAAVRWYTGRDKRKLDAVPNAPA